MSEHHPLLRTGDDTLVDYDLYAQIRDEASDLIHLPGSEITDNSYTLDVKWHGYEKADHVVGEFLHNFIWLCQQDNKDRTHESMLLVIEQDLVIDGMRHNLFSRRVGVTVFHRVVKYAQLKTLQPRIYSSISEAQPERELRGQVREDFETWESELRRTEVLTQACAGDVLRELIEIKAAKVL